MKNESQNKPFSVGLVAICSFIGVGFLTGAEIWFYFARFEAGSIFGLLTFGCISAILVYFSLSANKSQNKHLNRVKRAVLGVSELLIASAMMSGLLEVSKTLFGQVWLFVFLCAIFVTFCVLLNGMKTLFLYNYFIAGLVIFILLYLFCFNNVSLGFISGDFNLKVAFQSMFFGALYIFMNIAELRPVLSGGAGLKTKKQKVIFAIAFSSVLIFLVVLMSVCLISNPNIISFSMPFLLLFKNNGGWAYWVYLLSLLLAMISTALSCLMGVKNKIKFSKNDEKFVCFVVMILSLILGQIPFVCFVRVVYPAIAVLNVALFVCECVAKCVK